MQVVDENELLDALPVGIVIWRGDGQRVVNTRAQELQQTAPDGLLDSAIQRAITNTGAAADYKEAIEFAANGQTFSFVLTATTMNNGDTMAQIEDVSERRRVESIRRDFISNLGHELRTPIGAISLLSESLQDEPDSKIRQTIRDHISREASRAAELVDEFLSLARVEVPRANELINLDLRQIIDRALDIAEPSAMGASVALEVAKPDKAMNVRGLKDDLLSALTNLILNAIKYSDKGQTVNVTGLSEESMWLIKVEDQGIGIPKKDQARIFERFYRVDRSRNRQTGGTGIGLSVVRHVAANHQGWVSVTSREGEGSTFTIAIPRSEA